MQLLSGASLHDAIKSVLRGKPVRCAVAFWGKGAERLIGAVGGRQINLVCNLKMGGTNPDVIEQLINSGATVRQIDRLHAKVYIGDTRAIVTSANASINGLSLEGRELAGWIEAGVEVPASEALPWFDEIWNQSRPILPSDIGEARSIFRERSIIKPTRISFAGFHPTSEDYPLVSWTPNLNYDYNDSEIVKSLGGVNDTIHEQIDLGLDVEAPEDVVLFRRGLWVLHWSAKSDGTPNTRSQIWWTCSSGIHVPKAFTYEDDSQPQGVVLAMHPMPPVPFDPSERNFRRAFMKIMSLPKFTALRDRDYQGSFYTTARVELMLQFWIDLKNKHKEVDAGPDSET